MVRDSSSLPVWIPEAARLVYADTPLYHDPGDKRAFLISFTPRELEEMWKDFPAAKRERAFNRLFTAPELEGVWGRFREAVLQSSANHSNPWPYLVGGLVLAAGSVPPGRETRDRPGQKKRILDRQAEAAALVRLVARQAGALAASLRALKALDGAEVPAEMTSSLYLIAAGLAGYGGACCRDEWETFEDSLSSRQVMDFPVPAALLEVLADAAKGQPNDVLKENPWFHSRSSSWCDFIRMVKERLFPDLHRNHGCLIELRPAEWAKLVQAMIDKDINLEDVAALLYRIQNHNRASKSTVF